MNRPDGNAYCVYLLYSLNEQYKNKIFVGITMDISERLAEHNTPYDTPHVRKSESRGPWIVAMVVYGFRHEFSAIQFEWSWNNPDFCPDLNGQEILRLKHEPLLGFYMRVLNTLLEQPKWRSIRITIRIVRPYIFEYLQVQLPETKGNRVVVFEGLPALSEQKSGRKRDCLHSTGFNDVCGICCRKLYHDNAARCYHVGCLFMSHLTCLAATCFDDMEETDLNIGECPLCHGTILWEKLLRILWK